MPFGKNSQVPFVSVIICTYNRKKLLKSCLSSIYSQVYPYSNFEVIVIDGGSTDGTKELCKDFPHIRFITESKFGLAYARNLGAALARGSIVAYTDDDCIVDKYWLKSLIDGFTFSPKVMGVGGPVYPLYPEAIPKKIYVKAALGLYDNGENIKLTNGIITSNSAFKKEVFNAIKFDETLGITRRGKYLFSGEDIDFCRKILDSGYKIVYTPYAKVYHQILEQRIRVSYIVKHALHSGVSNAKIFLNLKHSRIWAIKNSLAWLLKCILKMPFDTSFTSCYKLLCCISALCVSCTGLDRIL